MLSGTNDQMMEPYMNIQTPERTLAHTVAKVSKTELVPKTARLRFTETHKNQKKNVSFLV
jgi:hypothetical protein